TTSLSTTTTTLQQIFRCQRRLADGSQTPVCNSQRTFGIQPERPGPRETKELSKGFWVLSLGSRNATLFSLTKAPS
ncbi:hypothetical protein B0H11DRAFT_2211035, partial [Mycena galericulata]